MKYNFEQYLILVGIRSEEYTYSHEKILNNIEYFKTCYLKQLSPYTALLFLYDHINTKKEMEKQSKLNDILSATQIESANIFYGNHKMHVDNLVLHAEKSYPPTLAEDKSNCMIWKAEHWKWFLNAE